MKPGWSSFKLTAICAVLLIGCGGKAFDYSSDNEIPSGPGVFSVKEGEFTVYNSDSGAAVEDQKEPTKAEATQRKNQEPEPAAATQSTESKEYQEFEDFQQWKQEKAEFEEYREWKKSNQGTEEYEEFKEWQRWREYQQWQEEQKKSP